MEYLESRTEPVKYYIHVEMNADFRIALEDEPYRDWQDVMFNYQNIKVCLIEHTLALREKQGLGS